MSKLLPQYIVQLLGSIEEPWLLWSDSRFVHLSRSDAKDSMFGDVMEALKALPPGGSLLVDDSLGEDGVYYSKTDSGKPNAVFSYLDIDTVAELEQAFGDYVVAYLDWKKNPTSFFHSYEYLRQHPAFWRRDDAGPIRAQNWLLGNGFVNLHVTPHNDLNGGYRFGATFTTPSDDLIGNYGMIRVRDVQTDDYLSGATYEETVVNLAAVIDYWHHPLGNQRDRSRSTANPDREFSEIKAAHNRLMLS